MVQPSEPSAPCGSCGAPIPAGEGERTATCAACGVSAPHPLPFRAGQAVLVSQGSSLTLGTVAAARGPDEVVLTRGGSHPVEALIPVIVAPAELEPGARVYADHGGGWRATWLVSHDGLEAVVKHDHPRFQSPFFDRRVPRGKLALPQRAADRRTRSRAQALLARVAGDPFGSLVRAWMGLVVVGMAVAVLVTLWTILL